MRKLTDSFGRVHNYLRISLTERCNLRCLYCMPAEGVKLQPDSKILTRFEIEKIARHFVDNGVNKIRLTGGEPTVRKDFMEIVESLGSLEGLDQLAMTTNGLMLPRRALELRRLGLTSVNISLDTLVEAKYNFFTRRQGLKRVLDAIDKSLEVGIPNVKVNCVVMRGVNDDELIDFVELAKTKPVQVRFIEYMPFDGNKWQKSKMMPYFDMLSKIQQHGLRLNRKSHIAGETSKNYTVIGVNGDTYAGSVGFITSMTSNFCHTCNRLRITADGNLKVCLFGNEEVSLRDMIRSGCSSDELQRVVRIALQGKAARHAGMNELKDLKNRPMILIGGNSICHRPHPSPQLRLYHSTAGSKLTHISENGEAHMVDVGNKTPTKRTATAIGRINFSEKATAEQIRDHTNKKGEVLAVARVAGIMAAKKTPDLIPLCHSLSITKIENSLTLDSNGVSVRFTVHTVGQTGVEMEALVGASMTLTTIYDMCKAVDKAMEITNIKVVEKTGGKHDYSLKS